MGPLGDPVALVDLAVRAEAAGWDGVFLWDHVLTTFAPIADTWTTLGAIATATQTILLGPMITPLPRRRPWVVARQASTVSRLSEGRLVLGVGLGADATGDFARFGDAAELQMSHHSGYAPRGRDRLDVARLADRFGLAMPSGY
jgi:alkanesulfonate monooxygenase SsuD/methylene tetrahydromethanopterin reductase-like flavin-dependent oxidoreductase (luciferase family)